MQSYDIPEDRGDYKGCSLQFSVSAGQIKYNAEKQDSSAAVHNKRMDRQDGKNQKAYGKIEYRLRKGHHQSRYRKRKKYGNQYGAKTAKPFFVCTPVETL